MKKVVVLLVCIVIVLVRYTVFDKSDTESSFGAKNDYEQEKVFYDNKTYEQEKAFYDNKEYDKTAELFKKACDGGEVLGCFNLGIMCATGNGVEKDLGKAEKLLKKACDGGETNGCRSLDIIYAKGNGAEKD